MKCKKCNFENKEEAKYCASCGSLLEEDKETENETKNEEKVEIKKEVKQEQKANINSLVFDESNAIVALIIAVCCCGNVIGIVLCILGLVEGGKVKDYVRQNDYESAQRSLDLANKYIKWAYLVIAIGVLLITMRFGIRVCVNIINAMY